MNGQKYPHMRGHGAINGTKLTVVKPLEQTRHKTKVLDQW